MAVPDFTLFNAQNLCARGTIIVSFRNNYGFGYGNVGEFFCYEGEVYEILSLGGGGANTQRKIKDIFDIQSDGKIVLVGDAAVGKTTLREKCSSKLSQLLPLNFT